MKTSDQELDVSSGNCFLTIEVVDALNKIQSTQNKKE
jgi:hypothetical protein